MHPAVHPAAGAGGAARADGATTVRLRFTASPEHVRTARLVATAVARRGGFAEGALESVRLAVGEACGRAVRRSRAAGTDRLVDVALTATGSDLAVVVRDGAAAVPRDGATEQDELLDGALGLDADDVSRLLMASLADDVQVSDGPAGPGGTTLLTWHGALQDDPAA